MIELLGFLMFVFKCVAIFWLAGYIVTFASVVVFTVAIVLTIVWLSVMFYYLSR